MHRFVLTLSLLALTGAAPVAAQESAPSTTEATLVQVDPAAEAAQAAGPASSGLPQVAPPPRTLRAYWHVFAAFAVAWGLLFGYAIFLARRSGALEEQVKRLEGSGA